ncbi:MAG: endonuclease/exonuclease/phosphatase family protein [Candidatus Bilamarchaeaceae archaeon]
MVKEIRIMTWNVQKRKNATAIWDYISKVNADIVMLQETTQHHHEKRLFEGIYDSKTGLAIYSKFPVSGIELESQFRVIAGKINLEGTELEVINIHNHIPEKKEYLQMLEQILTPLKEIMKKKNVIIGGDLNLGIPCDKQDIEYEKKCAEILDKHFRNGFKVVPTGKQITHSHNNKGKYLNDFIIVREEYSITKTDVLSDIYGLSDHYPVVAEIRI